MKFRNYLNEVRKYSVNESQKFTIQVRTSERVTTEKKLADLGFKVQIQSSNKQTMFIVQGSDLDKSFVQTELANLDINTITETNNSDKTFLVALKSTLSPVNSQGEPELNVKFTKTDAIKIANKLGKKFGAISSQALGYALEGHKIEVWLN